VTQLEYLLVGLIVAIVGHGIIVIYRSPKELFRAIEDRQREQDDNHQTLDRMLTRHDEVIKNLALSIDRLTQRIDRLEPYVKPRPSRGG
jgi:uncharacterized coiled-coil protein SlyX